MYKYSPKGVCSTEITFDIEDGIVKNVCFAKGCKGNLQAISRLVEGMPAEEAKKRLHGIICQNGTSCADQLATALDEAINGFSGQT